MRPHRVHRPRENQTSRARNHVTDTSLTTDSEPCELHASLCLPTGPGPNKLSRPPPPPAPKAIPAEPATPRTAGYRQLLPPARRPAWQAYNSMHTRCASPAVAITFLAGAKPQPITNANAARRRAICICFRSRPAYFTTNLLKLNINTVSYTDVLVISHIGRSGGREL